MASTYTISIIGAGNVAWHLAPALENAGHKVLEIYSRDEAKAALLADKLYEALPVTKTDFSESESSIFFLAVKDDVLGEVAQNFRFPANSIVAHTSGTAPLSVLDDLKQSKGVFYPLQTFSKDREIDFEEVPLIIESIDAEKILTEVALSICRNVYFLNSERRKILHTSAVFASNFVNHMLGAAKEILNDEQMSPTLLDALVRETVDKALESDPYTKQTGPAVRKDLQTMQSQLNYLHQKYSELEDLYKVISDSIIRKSTK